MNKELKKLSRIEILEIMLQERTEHETLLNSFNELQNNLIELQQHLADSQTRIEEYKTKYKELANAYKVSKEKEVSLLKEKEELVKNNLLIIEKYDGVQIELNKIIEENSEKEEKKNEILKAYEDKFKEFLAFKESYIKDKEEKQEIFNKKIESLEKTYQDKEVELRKQIESLKQSYKDKEEDLNKEFEKKILKEEEDFLNETKKLQDKYNQLLFEAQNIKEIATKKIEEANKILESKANTSDIKMTDIVRAVLNNPNKYKQLLEQEK